jgi:hypothetical protein
LSLDEVDNPDQMPRLVVLFFQRAMSAKADERAALFEALGRLVHDGVVSQSAAVAGYVRYPS